MKAKRVIAIAACMVMMLSLAACGGNKEVKQNTASESETAEVEYVQIANPWTECSDIETAKKNAGFSFEIPEEIEGYSITCIQNLDKEMIEVIYEAVDETEKSEEEDDSIHLRKGTGTEDISGDYNTYSESEQVTVGSYQVTMQGNNGSVSLATWTDGDFSYVVSAPEMSVETVSDIILQMK